MTSKITKEALSLIEEAALLVPEGEPLDYTDQEYTLEEIAGLRATLATMRRSIDAINRGLAQAWEHDYQGQIHEYGGQIYYLGYASKRVFIPGQDIEFAKWLKDQPVEVIKDVMSISGIKVTPLGRPGSPLRETFFDEEVTSDELRIKTRQAR